MTDPIARGERASRELEFLTPAFDTVIAAYTARIEELASTQPWEAVKITALANAARIAKSVRGQIENIIYEGEHAKSAKELAREIDKLSPARRRLFDIAPI